MSDFDDESPFDQDELREAFGNEASGDELTPEEVFSLAMVNKRRKVKSKVELRDANDEIVPLAEVVEQLVEYTRKKLESTEPNQFADQIYPLMAQTLVSGLGRFIGIQGTAYYLANETTRMSLIQMMSLSLLLLKFVQDKNYKILTIEEPVTDEEIETIERKSKANSLAMMGAMSGVPPRQILEELLNRGQITEDDLKDILKIKGEDDDDGNGELS